MAPDIAVEKVNIAHARYAVAVEVGRKPVSFIS
jgi:hypothetical protein